MCELHYEAKDKLTDLCKIKLEKEINAKIEQGKSSIEDSVLLEELKKVQLRVRRKTIRKPVRGDSESE